ncbi:MAG: tetratricopeptide repeat-containing glycosyltransferase family 2 protein [Paraclostridium sp.]|uniref:tetratricopeptide repeat-containing glycosyltransferase family 2 protein n=1 Tax=Paraclostridium sp. TaxID=2023273 RepID=UPI003F2FBF3F
MKSLSICMIVKNEEKNIARCLESIKEIADEIIIVDTGSSDKTIDICKKYNVKLINYEWNNNFSEARNVSLEHATKDYILCLDADEEIPKSALSKIIKLLSQSNLVQGYFLRLVNIINKTNMGEYIVFRLFENNPNYRFKGKIHEQIANEIQQFNGKDCTEMTDIEIYHYGYDSKHSDINKKYERNINILKSYDEKEKDSYYFYVLGNEYSRISDFPNAIESYENAIKMINTKYNYMFYPYLILNIVKVYSNTKQFYKELKFIESVKSTTSNFKDLYFMECLAYIECGKISKALESLDSYINCSTCTIYEYPNNKFENIYDINEMKNRLISAKVSNDKNLLSGLMILNEYDDTLIETIKSYNEIVANFVVITNNRELDLYKLKNIGTKIVFSKNKSKLVSLGLKECRGKYIILVEKGEICSISSQNQIIQLLSKTNKESFSMNVVSLENDTYSKVIKIIKNKNIDCIDIYKKNLIKDKKVIDSNIYIHKINKGPAK